MIIEKGEVHMSHDLLFKEMLCHKDNRDKLIHFIMLMTGIDKEKIKRNLNVQYENVLTKTKLSDKAYRADVLVKFDGNMNSFRKSTNYIFNIIKTGR